ncbi:hypothetical protein INT47_003630 [Mucor saturninus]|uniref:Uncharacterized protein n=1 Tax=Mucor saturninus TaxID=64648 RepID=A0A8H7R9M3_9FUNG|nr:hypothetical protein INT47_003630 [Mucor saturninus]
MFSHHESPLLKRRRRNRVRKSHQPKQRAAVNMFDELMAELDYSYDTLATINVIFDSLRFTYATSKNDIDRLKNNTILGDMEKELLIAYDDLTLQINHLEKNICKIEKKMLKLKDDELFSSHEHTLWYSIP